MIKKLTTVVLFTLAISFLNAQSSLDKVIAIIGNEAILESDIEMLYKDMQIRGGLEEEENPRCQVLKTFRDQKLLVAQAKIDSLGMSSDDIQSRVDRRIAAMIAQYGKEALEAHFNKSMDLFREETIDFETEQSFAQSMQFSLVKNIKVTPSEVARYFKSMDNDSVPRIIPDQYMIYEIVKKPDSEKAIIEVKEKLLGLRKRILDGEKFQTLAAMYSEHEVSAIRGGEWGLGPLEESVAPIRLALSSMRIGQVSKIIESEYGFHILQLLEKQDDTGLVNYRQILLKPKYSLEDQATGFARLDTIVRKVMADSISFENAALLYSENEKSRYGSGLMVNINNQTGEIRSYYYKDELNPDDFKAIEHIGTGEISKPFASTDVTSGSVQYKAVMLKEFIPTHTVNLKDDFNFISRLYENKKQNEAIENWVTKKAKTEYIRISEKYKECPFVDAAWLF
ncbi:MAG: peptidylprolyl isomerase [Prevotellaceae bacterium]|jgi:peptidyl-prolyl cis-trans isomerase SurA|nr:peptidylprolyl isomerase [Prevotellaceae bacterium]